MKLSLVVLAVLLGVALSSPVQKSNVDSLLNDLLQVLKREEQGSGTSGQGPSPGGDGQKPGPGGEGPRPGPGGDDSEEEGPEEKAKDAEKEGRKGLKKLKAFAEMCKIEMSKEKFMSPITMADVGGAYAKVHELINALAAKFDSHKDVLEKVEKMEEDDEDLENHKELMEKFAKIPDKDLVKKVMCGLGSLKLLITRAKHSGLSTAPEDFPKAQNCHATCGQLLSLLPGLKKGEVKVDTQAAKANVAADYKCLKSHITNLKAAFDKGAENHAKGVAVDGGQAFAGTMLLEHALEGLMTRGGQLHQCAGALYAISGAKAPAPPAEETQKQARELRSLLSTLEKMA